MGCRILSHVLFPLACDLGKYVNLSEFSFLVSKMGIVSGCEELREMAHVEFLTQCLVHSRCSKNVSCRQLSFQGTDLSVEEGDGLRRRVWVPAGLETVLVGAGYGSDTKTVCLSPFANPGVSRVFLRLGFYVLKTPLELFQYKV